MTTEAPTLETPVSEPKASARKIKVLIATPVRSWRGPEHLDEDLPHIGKAIKEFTLRGAKAPEDRKVYEAWLDEQTSDDASDAAFRAEASKYELEFAAAVGGLSRARNNLTHEALRDGFDFVLWNDDDLRPEEMSLAEAWLRLLSHRQPIVGALYPKREKGKRPRWACSFLPKAELQEGADGLLQVSELAIGLKCYSHVVFREIARLFGDEPLLKEPKEPSIRYRERETGETIYGFFQNVVSDGDLLSEDYWLDFLCRCARIGILADTKIKCRHESRSGEVYPVGAFPPIPVNESNESKP